MARLIAVRRRRVEFAHGRDAGRGRPPMQPLVQTLHRHHHPQGDDLDRPVRQIARDALNPESLGLESRAVAEINALNLARDHEAPNDPLQG